MTLIVRQEWLRQPPTIPRVRLDWGAREVLLPAQSPIGLVRGFTPSTEATFSLRPTVQGLGFNVTATGRRYTTDLLNGASVYGWVIVARCTAAPGAFTSVVRRDGICTPLQTDNSNNIRAATFPGGGLVTTNYGFTASQVLGKVVVYAGRVTSSEARVYCNVDGAITTTSITGGTGVLNSNANPLVLGATEGGAEVASTFDNLLTTFWQGTVPAEADFLRLVQNPWRLFQPRRIWVPVAAAVSGTPTLSAATFVPGSITSSGFTPRVTITF